MLSTLTYIDVTDTSFFICLGLQITVYVYHRKITLRGIQLSSLWKGVVLALTPAEFNALQRVGNADVVGRNLATHLSRFHQKRIKFSQCESSNFEQCPSQKLSLDIFFFTVKMFL